MSGGQWGLLIALPLAAGLLVAGIIMLAHVVKERRYRAVRHSGARGSNAGIWGFGGFAAGGGFNDSGSGHHHSGCGGSSCGGGGGCGGGGS